MSRWGLNLKGMLKALSITSSLGNDIYFVLILISFYDLNKNMTILFLMLCEPPLSSQTFVSCLFTYLFAHKTH